MLGNIFRNKKPNDPKPNPVGRQIGPLKIIHAGGHVEIYYMAVPAAWIMEKHPSHVLAHPEIFRRPWDSVVQPDEILVPGHKYYLVPRRTMKKLRRRVRKTTAAETASQHKDSLSSISGILVRPDLKVKALHVRFFDVETMGSVSVKSSKERLIDDKREWPEPDMKMLMHGSHLFSQLLNKPVAFYLSILTVSLFL